MSIRTPAVFIFPNQIFMFIPNEANVKSATPKANFIVGFEHFIRTLIEIYLDSNFPAKITFMVLFYRFFLHFRECIFCVSLIKAHLVTLSKEKS